MKLDERRGLSRVPPNHSGARPTSRIRRDASTTSLWLGSTLVGAFRRLCVLVSAGWPYLVRARKYLVLAVWLLGLVCQALLLWLAGELLDLFISAVELWVELVEKHLSILLDES